jgi:hypothetical protein
MRADGTLYAVPFASQTQLVIYNKTIFDQNGIAEPNTWEELVAASQKLKDAGVIPFANGTATAWQNETVTFGLGSTLFGRDFYNELIAGTTDFTDERFTSALGDVAALAKDYFADGFIGLDYPSAQQLFASGMAGMFVGGSYELTPARRPPQPSPMISRRSACLGSRRWARCHGRRPRGVTTGPARSGSSCAGRTWKTVELRAGGAPAGRAMRHYTRVSFGIVGFGLLGAPHDELPGSGGAFLDPHGEGVPILEPHVVTHVLGDGDASADADRHIAVIQRPIQGHLDASASRWGAGVPRRGNGINNRSRIGSATTHTRAHARAYQKIVRCGTRSQAATLRAGSFPSSMGIQATSGHPQL